MKRLLALFLSTLLLGQSALAANLSDSEHDRLRAGAQAIAALLRQPDVWQYDYTRPVPLSPAQGDEAFAASLFIGNSLGEGFRLYSGLSRGSFETAVGMTVYTAGSRVGCAAGKDRVYLMLGINEIGQGTQAVVEKYSQLIDSLRAAAPEADIYVQSLLPVYEPGLTAAQRQYRITNACINELNAGLLQMCAQKQVYYLDVHSALVNETGGLDKEKTWDGVHLTPEAYGIWLDYLRGHAA